MSNIQRFLSNNIPLKKFFILGDIISWFTLNESFDIDIEYESNIPHELKDKATNRQKYYKKGGKFGMYYYLSNEDKKIYKYYSVQYNGDNSIGFRCTDINCKSRAVLNPKNKEFKILAPHTLEFGKHMKLIGCYKTDKFIKSMETNKFKEIQLTKKDNKKIILWYKYHISLNNSPKIKIG